MSRAAQLCRALAAVVLVGAPLAGGSSRPPLTLIVAALGGVALAAALADARDRDERLELNPLAALLLLLGAVTLLQLVPLPAGLVRMLDPEGQRVRDLALRGLVSENAWRPLSLDPGSSLGEAARLLGLAALTLALGRLARTEREWLRGVLLISLAALIGCAALGALGLPLPHAVVPPSPHHSLVAFPFVNPNHAASFLSLLLPIGCVELSRAEPRRRLWIGLLLFAANAALFATLSRAGIAVGVGAEVLTLLVLWRADDSHGSRRLALWLGASLAVAMIALAAQLFAKTMNVHSGAVRLTALRDCASLIADHWRTGVGRGAFPSVFARYNRIAGATRFAFVENEYVQAIADYGLVLGGLVLAGLGALIWRAAARFRKTSSATTRAALIGLGALAVHNLVDFSWEMSGVAVIACALAALALPGKRDLPVRAGGGLAAGVALLVLCALLPSGRSAEADGAHLREAAEDRAVDTATFQRLAAQAYRRHPFDSFIADVAAGRLIGERDAHAFDWLNRALLVAPHDPLAHRLLAQALALAGARDQAALELRHAFEEERPPFRVLWPQATALFVGPGDGTRLAAALPRNLEVIHGTLDELGARKRWDLLDPVAHLGLEVADEDPASLRWLVRSALDRNALPDAATLARRLVAADRSTSSRLVAARALAAAEDVSGGIDALLGADGARSAEVTIALADLFLQRNQPEQAGQAVDAALARAVEAEEKAQLLEAAARVADRTGRTSRADADRAEAARLRGK